MSESRSPWLVLSARVTKPQAGSVRPSICTAPEATGEAGELARYGRIEFGLLLMLADRDCRVRAVR
jgi:hypothetical protein